MLVCAGPGEQRSRAGPFSALDGQLRCLSFFSFPLRQNLPVVQRRSAAATRPLRQEFERRQAGLIAEWEAQTNRTWPTGATPHHIIPIESGGANAWWNLMPTNGSLPNHSLPGIPGPHASGGVLRQSIQQGRRALPPGTTTDLRIPQ
jgi:hypothetical protein